ncbi:mercury(II) reductase [Alicyclobacillus ferrooxydans]|uniref:Mercuric reductase n=1 Tax=Alicyclobacillus ferrooxydans TaxID=471514 RepID=A0A0P9CDM0_9BACL|nr:mercury(II) reductase [Alicyclobacillus ferrooxydans]KPV43841.1 mercuric reductase [Alicyclobacillus ferrooxydans]
MVEPSSKKQIQLVVNGMTCDDCERHVSRALQSVGAENISASFRRNEATFELGDLNRLDAAKQAIVDTGYKPGDAIILSDSKPSVRPEMDGNFDYDLLIIGSGGSAFSAAIEATSYGAKVAMVERGTIGGTCVNIGCVPSKNMLRAGEINHLATHNPFQGLNTSAGPVELAKLIDRKDELVGELRQHKYVDLIEEYGFDLIQGEARFVDEETVEVDGQKITARNFLISTGASPAVPNIPGLKDVDYLVSTTALELKNLPKRLAVIGSGYIAMELGQMFHNLGAEVTLMQRSARVLKSYDPEVSEAVTTALTEQGMSIITGATFHRVEQDGDIKRIYLTVNGQERVVEAEALLVATGRKPNTAALNLNAAGVKTGDRGEVLVNDYLRTSNHRIYAAGDVTMGPQFVYVAAYEGAIVAKNALAGSEAKVDLTVVPGVTFTNPAIATVGLTEEQAKSSGYEVLTSVLPLEAVPRALVNRETTGIFKLVADAKTRKILGAHVVAENAGDVIYAAVLAVKFDLTIEDIRSTLAPYLTMTEGLKLATLTFDKDVSKLSCCAG